MSNDYCIHSYIVALTAVIPCNWIVLPTTKRHYFECLIVAPTAVGCKCMDCIASDLSVMVLMYYFIDCVIIVNPTRKSC